MPDSHRSTIEALRADFRARVASARTDAALKALHDEFLSRKSGSVTALLKQLGTLAPDLRREAGALVNELKTEIETALDEHRATLMASRPAGAVDVTLPGRELPLGRIHPLMRVRQEVEDIFTRMGYEILEGPEVEDDFHNFEALNMPPEHPARDMQDTFYVSLDPERVLRTQTSSVQVHVMQHNKPPIRTISPGRVYRNEAISARAHCQFHQVEGLYIDDKVSFADLKQTLLYFAREMFGPATQIRLRPSYFPFTEPSVELDIECFICGGKGCRICKYAGWLEILGAGMVHPTVLRNGGYDPDKFSGFAFGMGPERMALNLYGIDDIRWFFSGDERFLQQFG